MIKTLIKTHPLTHRLLRLIKSDVEEPLEPKELLTGTDKIIFKWILDQINNLRKPVDIVIFLRLRLYNILYQVKVKFTFLSELHRELVRFYYIQLESTFQEIIVYVQNFRKAIEVLLT